VPSFSWTQGISDNLLSCGMHLFHDTYCTMVYLGFTPASSPAYVIASWVVILFPGVEGSVSIF
jgi:hypothetical protein